MSVSQKLQCERKQSLKKLHRRGYALASPLILPNTGFTHTRKHNLCSNLQCICYSLFLSPVFISIYTLGILWSVPQKSLLLQSALKINLTWLVDFHRHTQSCTFKPAPIHQCLLIILQQSEMTDSGTVTLLPCSSGVTLSQTTMALLWQICRPTHCSPEVRRSSLQSGMSLWYAGQRETLKLYFLDFCLWVIFKNLQISLNCTLQLYFQPSFLKKYSCIATMYTQRDVCSTRFIVMEINNL